MKKKLLIANWKMHKDFEEIDRYFEVFCERVNHLSTSELNDLEVIFAAPFPYLHHCKSSLENYPFHVAAQNVHWEKSGAYTGEVSPKMLQSLRVHHALVGHSERRQFFNETDETINKKIDLFNHDLKVVLCVGETLAQRENQETESTIRKQLQIALEGVAVSSENLIIAYEPVWAIGTGLAATTEQAEKVHQMIRSWLMEAKGPSAQAIRVLYGGSMNAKNVTALIRSKTIDGGLVGGASLEPAQFAEMARLMAENT